MAHVVHPPSSGALEVRNCSADDRSEIVVHVFASNRSRHGALVAGVFFNFGELQGPPAVLPGELGVPPIPNRERRSITLIWQPMVQNTVVCSIVVVLCEHCFCGGFH